ncbi:MAG TPA: flagellar biosynthesis protein FlhA [Beijerinckiaceae bacterium]|nr:flagellar biosynthesis protein FlhA [Beijerinckiaceae bacterium]
MTDAPLTTSSPQRISLPRIGDLGKVLARGDLALALGVLGILVVLIVPLPPLLLDLLLAVSIIFSVLILMTALFIQGPLEFTSFPAVLLIVTMLRLALNLASTRLILANGHTGGGAAGHVIEAFGAFVIGGNFAIGIIVFIILVIVNFVVITKGSTRIAEVAARFTLDAMPGKQMAIDADLSSGLITQEQARTRRRELEDESAFFGAMDGASKFVRGDAIAGIMITFINVLGGMAIGILQQGMSAGDAARSYTLLTVGDGLVSQFPALIVSTAAGLLVSKAGVTGAADKALMKQLTFYPRALGLSAAVMLVIAVLPGMPMLPFLLLALGAGALARKAEQVNRQAQAGTAAEAAPPAEDSDNASAALRMDELRIEIGYGLLPLARGPDGEDRLSSQIRALRRAMATEHGFLMPAVRMIDNVQLEPNRYVIYLKEVQAGEGVVFPGQFMAMNPSGAAIDLPGQTMLEPAFGMQVTWIDAPLREEAQFRGLTVVDPGSVITTHLTEIIRANMPDLLSHAETQKLLRELPKDHADLVKELIPQSLSATALQRVLQALLAERVSIRDLPTIIEAIAEVAGSLRDPRAIAEQVRTRLARQICAQHASADATLTILPLSAHWEDAFATALVGEGEIRQLAIAPSKLHEFIQVLKVRLEDAAREGQMPVLVASAAIRPYLRMVIERFRPQTVVLSQAEIHSSIRLKSLPML